MTRDTGATVDDLDSSNLDKHVQHDFEINRSMKRVAKARFGPGHDVGGRRVAWPHLDTVWCDETGDGAYGPNGELVWTDGLQAVRRKPYSDTLLRDLMQASVSLPVPGLTRMRQTMAPRPVINTCGRKASVMERRHETRRSTPTMRWNRVRTSCNC